MKKLSYSRHHDPYKNNGDLDGDWIDDIHRRMFLAVEQDLTALEQMPLDDPKKAVRESLDLIERALRIKRLMGDAFPKRARKKRNRARQPVQKNRRG